MGNFLRISENLQALYLMMLVADYNLHMHTQINYRTDILTEIIFLSQISGNVISGPPFEKVDVPGRLWHGATL